MTDLSALRAENQFLRSELADQLAFPRILGSSPVLAETWRRIRALAPSGDPILLVGEPGTGKALLARAIHHLGPRRDRRFVRIDCTTDPNTWIERLEFSGAGILFFDRIDAASPEGRARMLELLADASRRIVASTDREPRGEVARGKLRTVPVPPLRARDGDIPLLAAHFLASQPRAPGREPLRFSVESLEAMRAYPWPGNVRELQTCIERAAMIAEGERIEPRHLAISHRAGTLR